MVDPANPLRILLLWVIEHLLPSLHSPLRNLMQMDLALAFGFVTGSAGEALGRLVDPLPSSPGTAGGDFAALSAAADLAQPASFQRVNASF